MSVARGTAIGNAANVARAKKRHVDLEPVIRAIHGDDRLETVFVVIGVEQPQLLAAMGGIESVVNIGDNLRVITWGQHMATNEYADVPNVILAGTLFMRDSFYTALAHLAKDRNVAGGFVTRTEVATIMRGEHAHLVLQALCRGRVRRSHGAKCLPMDAYLIASAKSGIAKDIIRIFPGCRIVPWTPEKKVLTGQIKSAVEYVRSAIDTGQTWISYRSIYKALGTDRTNFRKWVLKKDDWKDAIAELGLEMAQGPQRAMGLRHIDQQAAD
jgi:hypothetical protein